MGGGGGMSGPSPSVGRSPSFSQPAAMPSRPATRPSGGATPSARPSPGLTPGSRPGTVDFARPSTRPSGSASTGLTPGARPATGSGPGVSQLPSAARPGAGAPAVGARPGIGPGPGISQLPVGQRPGGGAGTRPSLPGGSTALLPGLGNRPGLDGPRPGQLPARPNTPQERRGDLQNRLATRDQVRDRSEIREDWQDRAGNIYDRHEDWHHGNWHGNAGGWWHHMWSDHTALMVFGTTIWGINRLAYGFGYWGYSNPYYSEPYPVAGGAAVDYSKPIAMEAPANAQPTDGPTPGMTDFDAARQAFYQGDYAAALAATNKALAVLPNDPVIHEFRALVMFAQGKYQEAAAGLYSVLAVGPGWDWTTLSSLYPNVDAYTKQLRTLEAYIAQHPEAADARFVLAYHYLTTGGNEAASAQLKRLYAMTPQDVVIKELLLMTAGPEAIGASAAAPAVAPSAPQIAAADFTGVWTSAGQNKTTFALELTRDGAFTWNYAQGGRSENVKGVYALDGNVLAMEPDTGGVMLAEVTQPQGGRFDFRLLGAPPGDPGLEFVKSR